jgi:2-keto-3-deoxy-L-rhamnonate aldolase RhmA
MQANDTVLSVILIEDIEAVANIDQILEVDGIDVFFVAFAGAHCECRDWKCER